MLIAARPIDTLYAKLGDKVKENVPLAPYTSARIGGPADIFLMADTSAELARYAKLMWKQDIPFTLLGGGSNVLVSDQGIRGVVILKSGEGSEIRNRRPAVR